MKQNAHGSIYGGSVENAGPILVDGPVLKFERCFPIIYQGLF